MVLYQRSECRLTSVSPGRNPADAIRRKVMTVKKKSDMNSGSTTHTHTPLRAEPHNRTHTHVGTLYVQ